MHNLRKISAVGVELLHTDGRTHVMSYWQLVTTLQKSPKEVFGGVWRGIVWPKLAVLAGFCDGTSDIIQGGKLW